jgi:hypothetical protein
MMAEAAISAPCSVKANGMVGENLSRQRWSQFATTSSHPASFLILSNSRELNTDETTIRMAGELTPRCLRSLANLPESQKQRGVPGSKP